MRDRKKEDGTMNMGQKGSGSHNGPVTVTKVAPWTPEPKVIAGWDDEGNEVFEVAVRFGFVI